MPATYHGLDSWETAIALQDPVRCTLFMRSSYRPHRPGAQWPLKPTLMALGVLRCSGFSSAVCQTFEGRTIISPAPSICLAHSRAQ